MLEEVAHLVLDLEWPFIVEQVQIDEFGRHQASVLQMPTFDYGMAFRPGIPLRGRQRLAPPTGQTSPWRVRPAEGPELDPVYGSAYAAVPDYSRSIRTAAVWTAASARSSPVQE